MDSDHEEDHEVNEDEEDEEEKSEGQQQHADLTGFLFGNIDQQGRLEDDLLDEDSKRHLGGLSALGMESMVKEITQDEASSDAESDTPSEVTKLESAVDYSDISEVAVDEDEVKYKAAMSEMKAPSVGEEHPCLLGLFHGENSCKYHLGFFTGGADDYDDAASKDSELMPPPTWIPSQSTQTAVPPQAPVSDKLPSHADILSVIQLSMRPQVKAEAGPKLNTPLASMLPPELADKDVREWFPEFRSGQVLRFSRLFKPVYSPHIYKRKKKKKPEEEGSEAAGKAADSHDLDPGSTVAEVKDVDDDSAEDEEEYIDCPFELNMGRPAKPEEMMQDEAVGHVTSVLLEPSLIALWLITDPDAPS